MTEQIKSAIEQIQTEMIKDIDIPKSAKTELANQKALHLAIRSLSAWEEVLQEVERQQKNGYWAIRLDVLTEFINQKLSEIEE